MTDQEKVKEFLNKAEYMVLAVILEDGSPWAVPVRLKHWDKNVFEWDSKLDTEHSRAISTRSVVAITMYEKKEKPQVGLYAKGKAELVEMKNHGYGRYRFTAEKVWINDETFQKREVSLS